jgi:hypothetical protein
MRFNGRATSDAGQLAALVAADGSSGGFIKDSEASAAGLSMLGSASAAAQLALLAGEPNRNHIINGDMALAQRASETGINNTTPRFVCDRWRFAKSNAAVLDMTQDTSAPTFAEAGRLITASLKLDCTTADASVGSTDSSSLQYRMEGYDWRRLAQRDLILSFWVKSTKTGTFCFAIQNGVDRGYVAEYTINASDTWEFKSISIPASPSAGTWDYTTGVGAYLLWTLMAGSDASITGTAGSWQSATHFATSNQANIFDNTANNFWLTGVRLEPGSVVSRGEPDLFPVLLAKCQRYYQTRAAWVPTAGGDKANIRIDMRGVPTIAGGGAGFASTGTTKDTLICEQTTGAVQTLTLSAEL